jgi:L-alanine-DL-glutamate epimerase-like enolase superfamily enzyme
VSASDAAKVRLLEVERFERSVPLRLPFRFGVTTITHAAQAIVRVRIALADGRTGTGVAAESLGAKWFDKNPALTDAQNYDQLRQSLQLAIDLYRARGFDTPFGLFAATYPEQHARAAGLGLNPLIASYGPALLDRAVLDAIGRVLGLPFADMIRRNIAGIAPTPLAPDLAGFDWPSFLAEPRPGASIAVRHTVGLSDPITTADQRPGERVDDGLPETLQEVVQRYRGRYYKLKVSGAIEADAARLTRIASVLDSSGIDYRVTLDGNEQYEDVEGVLALWRRMGETPALARLMAAILFIEQPIKRSAALGRSVAALASERPLIIDESDGELSSFPEAVSLGYAGVSSKLCKGLYKSIINAARIAVLNQAAQRPVHFLSSEDLTTWPGVSVQQDTALVSLLGPSHVERNAHHFIDGMSFAPRAEQDAFLAAHPRLYERSESGTVRLRIRDGQIAIGSLDCPGFAVGADMDFTAMRAMPDAPMTWIGSPDTAGVNQS